MCVIREGLIFKPKWDEKLRYNIGKPKKNKLLEEGEENYFPISRYNESEIITYVSIEELKATFDSGEWIEVYM